MKRIRGLNWQKSMLVTVVMIIFMAAASFAVTGWINQIEEEYSFEILSEEAQELVNEINGYIDSDREQLEMVARVIAHYEDLTGQEVRDLLGSYRAGGMMSRLELLLPNNRVFTENGEYIDANGILSFEEQAAKGAHISNRETDLADPNLYILRHYVPVVKDNQTVAILYGIVELGTLPEELMSGYYGGDAAIYIIDGNSGDFLVDTWHNEFGNIWALGEREMAPGYDHEQLKKGLQDGKTGYVVFVSRTVGEYLYFYYEPIGINAWQVALSVPESIVFARANGVKQILTVFLIFEAVCFLLYFVWMYRHAKRQTNEKQRQLDTLNYIYDVEKLLFNAHQKQENIIEALEKIAHITTAEQVCFCLQKQFQQGTSYLWEKAEKSGMWEDTLHTQNIVGILWEYFQEGASQFAAYGKEEFQAVFREKPPLIQSLMAVPVEDTGGTICGILIACNMKDKEASLALLKSVSFSFLMFYHNMRSYYDMKEQGEKDILTGLLNRNRFERDLSQYYNQLSSQLACVYIDVNGLHELNNTQGHEAGDIMLHKVADQIRKQFGDQSAYRIGGDEFVVFIKDREENSIEKLCRNMESVLEKEQIHISIGIQWEKEVSSIRRLIKKAEKKMYVAKRAYYAEAEKERMPRNDAPADLDVLRGIE